MLKLLLVTLNLLAGLLFLPSLTLIASSKSPLGKKKYVPYPHDESGLKKFPEIFARYKEMDRLAAGGLIPKHLLKQRLKDLQYVVKRSPTWTDGLWVLAANHVGYASTLVDPSDRKEAHLQIKLSKDAAQKCLQIRKDHVLCKFFLAVAMGQESSLKGLFASIALADDIYRLFVEVYQSQYDFRFDKYGSVQATTRDALGTFMRIVPDSYIVEWILGVKGNKRKAIAYHREGIELVGYNTCNTVFLATANLCYSQQEGQRVLYQERGESLLKKAQKLATPNAMLKNCRDDAIRILVDPNLACGYTPLNQQEDEDMKKLEDKLGGP